MALSSLVSLLMGCVVVASFLMLSDSRFPGAAYGASVIGNETDREALLAFKAGITSDPHGALNSWNQSIHFCQWIGVTCGRQHQRVTTLSLVGKQLRGSFSPYIGNLSFLRVISMGNNSLGPRIPPEFGRLKRLQVLSLRSNSMGGDIPSNISGCSSLAVLQLGGNRLEGIIPVEIGMLSKLEELSFGWNLNIAGSIRANLANLSSLRIFYASGNSISGNIPDRLDRLKSLESFEVASNNLVGTVPPSIYNASSVRIFVLQDNQLSGSLPSELGGVSFPLLERLDVAANLFTGAISISISNASHLNFLDGGANELSGAIPSLEKLIFIRWLNFELNSLGTAGQVDDLRFLSSLTNATRLELLSLHSNNLGGMLPVSINNFSTSNLELIDLYNNSISGSIPDGIGNLVGLGEIQLGNNKFTGMIPPSVGKLSNLQEIDLSVNNLDGMIPPSFGNVSLLLSLNLGENNLHGNIPSSLGRCTNLQELHFHSNNLQGSIPREVLSVSSLFNLDVGDNHLNGSLPIEIGSMINLEELDISQNMLSGKIPGTIDRCVKLSKIYMGSNNLAGILPSLSSLKGLEVLNLSRNNFSGKIPEYLEDFKGLQSLDISFNNFEGVVPQRGVFENMTAFVFEGNARLCADVPELKLPSCRPKTSKSLNAKLIIVLAVVFTGVVLMSLLLLFFCMRKKSKNVPSLGLPWSSFLRLSYENLYEATNGFSTANLIGQGSFGSVYKGLLDQDQQIVAVKVLKLESRGASRSFMAECEALRRIRHRNLLKIITACSTIDRQGNDFRALVYQFMVNGSLDDWLHPNESGDHTDRDLRILSFSQRLNIAIDVAFALDYLHHHCPEPIVHCDLKPSNILLDSEMVGHVGDFGLARFLQEYTYMTAANQSSSIGVRGSVGYVAPEYGMGNEVSTSGDVYSYGILLLEMFTGKRPTDNMFSGSLNLHDFVKIALPQQIATVVDSTLFEQSDKAAASKQTIEECLVSVLEVGIACSQESPLDRMAISDVIVQLHLVKHGLHQVE